MGAGGILAVARRARLVLAVLACLFALALTGCAAATEDPVAADPSGSVLENGGDTAGGVSQDACFFGDPEVTLDLAGVSALVVALEDGGAFLTEDELSDNAWTLNEDGSFESGIAESDGDCPDTELDVERVDAAPTGEVYILFANSIRIAGERCRFVVVDENDAASCADTDFDFEFYQVEFTPDGNAYFSDREGTIKMRNRVSGAVSTLIEAASLGYALDGFKPLHDGTLLLQGELEGSSRGFYRFIPAAVSGGTDELQSQCLADVDINVKGSAPENELFIASDGSVYLRSNGGVCDGLAETDTYRAEVGPEGLELTAISGVSADRFAEDPLGNVFAVTGDDDDVTDAAIPLYADGSAGEPLTTSLAATEVFEVHGDAIYATGTDAGGKSSFLRKSLATGEETDLIGDKDLVVQAFDVNGAGDVAFSALDESQARRVFYRYDNGVTESDEDAALEELAELPGEALKIVYVGDFTGAD